MASKFTDAQLSKWANDREKEICAKNSLLADRLSLTVTSGTSTYELPNYVTNIRSILYFGKEVHPKGGTAVRITGNLPFETTSSAPYEYQVSGLGQRVIKFYPSPMDNIPEVVGDLWNAAADEAGCIIEFYRTPITGNAQLSLPPWMRRYLLKNYICAKAFGMQGVTQDLRAEKFYLSEIGKDEIYIAAIKGGMHQSTRRVISPTRTGSRSIPGRPVLPPNFGYPVNF